MRLYTHFCSYFQKRELLCCEVIFLKELYMKLPTLLKKQIALNVSAATLAIILFFIVIFCFSDVVLALPCLILSVLLIVKTAILFYNCIAGNYLEIKGVCSDVEKTPFRKRIKSITLKAEDKKLKLNAHYSKKNICCQTITTHIFLNYFIMLSKNAKISSIFSIFSNFTSATEFLYFPLK